MIYDVNSNAISSAYDSVGNIITQCYDIDGNSILDTVLRVMTYNVQWFSGLNADVEMQNTILDKYEPMLIGLQELGFSMPSIGSQILSPRYRNITLGIQQNKTGIATNLRLIDIESRVFVNQATEQRGYQTASFIYKGKTVFFVNAHLETSTYESIKVAQAKELFDLVQTKETFILMGDFNTICKNTSDTEYTTIMKQFIDEGYNSANCSLQHGFIDTWTGGKTAQGAWYPCDHIITSSDFLMTDVERDTIKIATGEEKEETIDHVALTATLDFTS